MSNLDVIIFRSVQSRHEN